MKQQWNFRENLNLWTWSFLIKTQRRRFELTNSCQISRTCKEERSTKHRRFRNSKSSRINLKSLDWTRACNQKTWGTKARDLKDSLIDRRGKTLKCRINESSTRSWNLSLKQRIVHRSTESWSWLIKTFFQHCSKQQKSSSWWVECSKHSYTNYLKTKQRHECWNWWDHQAWWNDLIRNCDEIIKSG